jgi:hypothetical protein
MAVAKVFLVLAGLANLALAAPLIALSGFLFGSGPESMHGGAPSVAAYAAGVFACLAAPVAGFIFNRRAKVGPGLAIA